MTLALSLGVVTPLLAVWSARRRGERRLVAGGLVAAGVVLALVGGVVGGFYVYLVDISAGLCGPRPALANAAGAAGYAIVVGLAVRRPRFVWAWPLAVWAGLSVSLLVAYWFSSAHTYCET